MFFFLILVLSHPYHLCFHAHFYFLTSFPPLLLLTVSSPSSSPLSLLFLPFPISSLLPTSSSLLAHFRHSAPNSILLSSPDPHLFTFSLILHFISPNFTSWRGQECYSGVTNPRWIPSVWVAGLMSSDQPRQPAATLLPFYWRWVTAIKVTCVCVYVAKCDADLHMCVDYLSCLVHKSTSPPAVCDHERAGTRSNSHLHFLFSDKRTRIRFSLIKTSVCWVKSCFYC